MPTLFKLRSLQFHYIKWLKKGHSNFKALAFWSASENIFTKSKSQGLYTIRIKYWNASGSGSPPSDSRPLEHRHFTPYTSVTKLKLFIYWLKFQNFNFNNSYSHNMESKICVPQPYTWIWFDINLSQNVRIV